MDFQKQIKDMIEKRAQELAEAKIQLILQGLTVENKSGSPSRRASKTPRGAIKKAVLAALTNSPMYAAEIADRVKKVSPGFEDHQINSALSQLTLSKKCLHNGKRTSYKYFVKSK